MALIAAATGCGTPTLPDRDIVLSILEDTGRVLQDSTHAELSIRVQLQNADTRPVYVTTCGHALYHQAPSGPELVYSSRCGQSSQVPLVVEPGRGTLIGIRARARLDTLRGRWVAASALGAHYAIVWVTSAPSASGLGGTPLPASRRRTPTFPVRVRRVP